ncbi:MAG: hypothetical protein DRN68_01185 [Thaumarchaeota archaeon]|nr:MAG: hypothetical protein DRN68_01185 [Nitrososphaerota archaeon]
MLEDKLYWGRFLGGIVMGFLTNFFKLYKPTIFLGILVAALAYIISAMILRVAMPLNVREKLGRKLYISGAGTYAVMWLITLILCFNLF